MAAAASESAGLAAAASESAGLAAAASESAGLAAAARAAADALTHRIYDFSAASFCGVSASDVEAFQEEDSCGRQRVSRDKERASAGDRMSGWATFRMLR